MLGHTSLAESTSMFEGAQVDDKVTDSCGCSCLGRGLTGEVEDSIREIFDGEIGFGGVFDPALSHGRSNCEEVARPSSYFDAP